jgi:exodeoxyribonuclease VII large subunit
VDALALPFDAEPTYTVGELNAAVSNALAAALPGSVWVRGEVSHFHASANGHAYFELIEKDGRRDDVRSVLRVALFRTDRATVNRALRESGVQLGDGIEVRIRGRIDYYPPQGRLQVVMNGVDPVFTVGRMAADRAQLVRLLADQGLLHANAAHPIPLVPLRIGLVTSGGSAAYHDFLHELEASRYAFRVAHCNARVQGAAAQRRIAYALRRLAGMDLDVVVLIRGGGSRSDLAPFDTEVVARAIASMPMPVFTGIGHEVDRTVADEVAHTYAKTPTAAAAMLVDRVAEFDAQLARASQRVAARARSACRVAQHQLDAARTRVRRAPIVLVRERERVTDRRRQVAERARRATRDAARDLDGVAARLRALDPQRVLERGYSITRTESGEIVRSAAGIDAGAVLVTDVADGRITSRVEEAGD